MVTLKHNHDTINMNKCKWFQDRFKFVRMGVAAGIKKPSNSKNDKNFNLDIPKTWIYMHMNIVPFWLYRHLFPIYELYMLPWIYIL